MIVVDQMRSDYLDRFSPYFGDKGFQRLIREGRLFTHARYAHATTFTGPGHAVIGSGIYANRSGIVGNRWYSRDRKEEVYCVLGFASAGRPDKCLIGDETDGSTAPARKLKGPCNFGAESLSERIKGRYRRARVIGVSLKDRAAILMVGRGADAAYWLDDQDGGSEAFECSAYYPACRKAVLNFSREEGLTERPGPFDPRILFQRHPGWRRWDCSLPEPCEKACPEDDPEAHVGSSGLGRGFPHPVGSPEALSQTPFGNDLLEAFVERVTQVHDLGRNPAGQPDLLAVSFSSPDYLGHLYGPDSCEVADGMKRLDGTLGRLLDFLVRRVGRDNLVVFLTSDHGVAPLPEVSLRKGIPAGWIELSSEAGRRGGKIGDLPELCQRLEYAIARRMNSPVNPATPLREAFVVSFEAPNLYLNRERIGAQALPLLRRWLKKRLLAVDGIAEVYTSDEVRAGEAPEAVRLAFREDRSGDLVILLKPYWILGSRGGGADHGQVYDYDSRVPLVIWGRGVMPGVEEMTADVAQIAPTIAAILGLDFSGFSRPEALPLGLVRQGGVRRPWVSAPQSGPNKSGRPRRRS